MSEIVYRSYCLIKFTHYQFVSVIAYLCIELDGKYLSSRLNMAGIRGYKRDGTLAGLCLVIGGGSCKWQLTALVKSSCWRLLFSRGMA